MRKILCGLVAVLVSGCGQKQEVVRFDEAVKNGTVEFRYVTVYGGVRGERDTEWAREVPIGRIPSSLAFTPDEKLRVAIDRHLEGTVVRVEIVHEGQNRCCEATMDISRVYTGTGSTRGRKALAYNEAEVIRHTAPIMIDMLRADDHAEK